MKKMRCTVLCVVAIAIATPAFGQAKDSSKVSWVAIVGGLGAGLTAFAVAIIPKDTDESPDSP